MRQPIMPRAIAAVLLGTLTATIFSACPGTAKEKAKPLAKPTCARASYPGDPVCDLVPNDPAALPTASSQIAPRAVENGYRVNDDVSISGKNDFNANRYGGTYLNNPSPNPRLQDVNGGGSLNYKFR